MNLEYKAISSFFDISKCCCCARLTKPHVISMQKQEELIVNFPETNLENELVLKNLRITYLF